MNLVPNWGCTMVVTEGEILHITTPKNPENAFSGIFTYLKLVKKYYFFAIFQRITAKTSWISIYSNLRYVLEFLQKIENLDMFPSKREISRSNGRMEDNLSKRESPVQNGKVGTYGYVI